MSWFTCLCYFYSLCARAVKFASSRLKFDILFVYRCHMNLKLEFLSLPLASLALFLSLHQGVVFAAVGVFIHASYKSDSSFGNIVVKYFPNEIKIFGAGIFVCTITCRLNQRILDIIWCGSISKVARYRLSLHISTILSGRSYSSL